MGWSCKLFFIYLSIHLSSVHVSPVNYFRSFLHACRSKGEESGTHLLGPGYQKQIQWEKLECIWFFIIGENWLNSVENEYWKLVLNPLLYVPPLQSLVYPLLATGAWEAHFTHVPPSQLCACSADWPEVVAKSHLRRCRGCRSYRNCWLCRITLTWCWWPCFAILQQRVSKADGRGAYVASETQEFNSPAASQQRSFWACCLDLVFITGLLHYENSYIHHPCLEFLKWFSGFYNQRILTSIDM